MTDGAITQQYTAKDPNLPVRTSNNHKVYVEPGTNITQNDAQAEKLLFLVCDTAKAKNVIVFTIGFEINPGTADGKKIQKQMGYCASSPSHFFDVKGLNINAAFQSIASAIQKIKLTQ
jgi:coproporphyrinogen III oxidase-like Fe-S oxidoreductase